MISAAFVLLDNEPWRDRPPLVRQCAPGPVHFSGSWDVSGRTRRSRKPLHGRGWANPRYRCQ